MQTKIMTYNIQHGQLYRQPKDTIDVTQAAEVIRQSGAELIGLNEVRGLGQTPTYTAQVERMAAYLGYHCWFGRSIYVGGTEPYGNAVLSRHPIVEARVIRIPDVVGGHGEPRSVTRAVIEAPDGDSRRFFAMYVSHFGLSTEEREHAVSLLCSLLRDETLPFMLMGDFNTVPMDPVLSPLYEMLHPIDGREGAPTFPSHAPAHKIDYLFASPDVTPVSAEVLDAQTSDHRPLCGVVEW